MENTTFEEVFNAFLLMVSDYNLSEFTEDELNAELYEHLKRSMGNFINVEIEIDELMEGFKRKLTNLEINILTLGMLSSFLNQKLYSINLFKPQLSSKDFQSFSNANLLKEIQSAKLQVEKDYHYYQQRYSLQKFIKGGGE